MPRYLFHGDAPRALPEYAIDYVAQGQTIETINAIDHPDFELLVSMEKPKSKPESAPEAPKQEKA